MSNARELSQVTNITESYKNKIINGAMVIDNYNQGASVTPTGSGTFVVDRWGTYNSQPSKFSVRQMNARDTTASNYEANSAPPGFVNSLKFTSTSAYSIPTAEIFGFAQCIEGFNIQDLNFGTANAIPVMVSFWVKSSLTGKFGVFLKNGGVVVGGTYNNLFYTDSYTINAANTWEYKTILITPPTSGGWEFNSNPGLCLAFSLGAGATYTGGSASWTGNFYNQPSGSVNLISNNGATLYITGIQVEKGTVATEFDFRSIGQELELAQRYAFRYSAAGNIDNYAPFGIGRYYGTNAVQLFIKFPVTMRYPPGTIIVGGSLVANDLGFGAQALTSIVLNERAYDGATITGSTTTGVTAGNATTVYSDNASNAYIIFQSEL